MIGYLNMFQIHQILDFPNSRHSLSPGINFIKEIYTLRIPFLFIRYGKSLFDYHNKLFLTFDLFSHATTTGSKETFYSLFVDPLEKRGRTWTI